MVEGKIMSINPLTIKELQEQAPALFTEQPHYEVSDKYHFIPTIIMSPFVKTKSKFLLIPPLMLPQVTHF